MRRLLALSGILAVIGLVTWRAWMHPVDTYGDSGAGYIEHLERIRVLNRLTTSGGGLWDKLRAADGLYPPGLHFLSAPASFLGDHEPASVTILGGMWLLLLAASVAACARTIRPGAGLPALTATVLVPALHAVAPRYYYDLPMTAMVWLCAAILAHARHHAVGSAVLASLGFVLACGIKWSALPLGLPIVLAGLLLAARQDRSSALRAAAVFGVTTTILLTPLMLASTSFGAMGGATFQPPPGVALPDWSASLDAIRPGLGHALGAMALQARLGGPIRALFYLERSGTTILAPALLPSGLVFLLWWVRERAPGALAVAAAVVPVVLFVIFAVPPFDERFLLSILPVVPLVAGVVLSERSRWTDGIGGATMVLAVAVAVDFHTGATDAGPDTRETDGHITPRRWGLSTSMDRRGWARLDDLPDHQHALRAAVMDVVRQCGSQFITGDDSLIARHGDLNWWTFELEREALLTHAQPRQFHPTGSSLAAPSSPPDLAFTVRDIPPSEDFEPLQAGIERMVWTRGGACNSRR